MLHRLASVLSRVRDSLVCRCRVPEGDAGDHVFLHLMRKYLEPGAVVFDIGAFDGTFSRIYHEAGYVVHAFEGAPQNAETFKENCAGLADVTLHEVALHDCTKTCRTRFNDCRGTDHPEIEAHYVEFDRYWSENGLPPPDYVKMDIEGMESVALKKMGNLIQGVRPIFQIEVHNSPEFESFKYADYPSFVGVDDGGFDFTEFVRRKYAMYIVETNGALTCVRELNDRRAQYLFVPEEVKGGELAKGE